jgi:hypothetical protein
MSGTEPRPERGQATVELVALLPLLVVVALSAFAVLASRAAHEQAGAAAEAGAIALLQERDASAAARDALPRAARARSRITVRGSRVAVAVRPRVPLLSRLLSARVTADAGSAPVSDAFHVAGVRERRGSHGRPPTRGRRTEAAS